ncbi:MAG TPA: Gfo/Idh/MocA family oxidoreductase [Cyclobacteriaceae bacterium]|nr:Gfo/Idh/MocA family oxidoreductase [Cyclobacteriaceae bacterium]
MKLELEKSGKNNRRDFLKSTSALLIGGAVLPLGFSTKAQAANDNTLKVGLIGCGGRGTGAAVQALKADSNAVLTCMADAFADHLENSLNNISKASPNQVKVDKTNQFVGFDAYQKVLDSDVDVVILTTPPAFRPGHFKAAIEAGKHVFCEKPVAVDAPGVRSVLESARKAKEKGLAVVSGFTFRYDFPKRAFFEKVNAGQLGEVLTVSTVRNGGGLWSKPRQPEWKNMEYQLRNWLYYDYLSGDYLVEMMCHSLDMMSWAVGDQLPISATGTGGRQARTEEIYGNVWDHFAIEYDFANGAKGFHFSRQQQGCSNTNKVEVVGKEGFGLVDVGRGIHQISGANAWSYDGEKNNPYETQHEELFASIRAGKPMNEGELMANSTMLAVLGRMVGYSGQTITWEDALKSEVVLGPSLDQYSWDLDWKINPVAVPGVTKVV